MTPSGMSEGEYQAATCFVGSALIAEVKAGPRLVDTVQSQKKRGIIDRLHCRRVRSLPR